MKVTLASIIIAIIALLIEESSLNTIKKDQKSAFNNVSLWHQGKVPYEISYQFVRDDLIVIKNALVEVMNTTCIEFVPHTNEPDYVVFLGYKHPNEEKGTCWSGNQWNNGTSTVGNKRGRHLVSLWPELECFNKLDIIREISNILGFQAKSSTFKTNPTGRSIINGAFPFYEEGFEGVEKQTQPNSFVKICMNESTYLKKHPYAFDNKKEWVSMVKKDNCRIVRNMKQINQMYNCPNYSFTGNLLNNTKTLDHVRPNCKAEAETGACQSDPVYMSSISCNRFCAGWGSLHGTPTPRRANLINGFGKCLGIGEPTRKNKDRYLYQWDCNSSNDSMLWSWNQVTLDSGDRHICNGRGACIVSSGNVGNSIHLLIYKHLDEQAQRFHFSDSLAHPGFYVIQNDYGKCLSVNGNTNQIGAQIWVRDCNNPSEAGQRWKWQQ